MDQDTKKRVLRRLTYGAWVISAAHGEDLEASTITWVSQASFAPPLLMLAIKTDSHLYKTVAASKAFALHLLSTEQQELAGSFSRPTAVAEGKIGGLAFAPGPATGSPILEGFSCWLEARVTDEVSRGDHTVVVAEVVAVTEKDAAARPLALSSTPWFYGG